jgi:hypothetical protein
MRSSTPCSQMIHAVTRSGSPAFVTLESVICSGVSDRGCRAARRGTSVTSVSVSNTCSTSGEVGALTGRAAIFGSGRLDLRLGLVAGRLPRCVAFADQVLESCHRIWTNGVRGRWRAAPHDGCSQAGSLGWSVMPGEGRARGRDVAVKSNGGGGAERFRGWQVTSGGSVGAVTETWVELMVAGCHADAEALQRVVAPGPRLASGGILRATDPELVPSSSGYANWSLCLYCAGMELPAFLFVILGCFAVAGLTGRWLQHRK